jgi:hypothetical protein
MDVFAWFALAIVFEALLKFVVLPALALVCLWSLKGAFTIEVTYQSNRDDPWPEYPDSKTLTKSEGD